MFSKHVSKELSTYCHGELSAERSRAVAEHLLNCRRCRSEYDEIKLGIELAERMPQLSAPQSLWSEIESLLDSQSLQAEPRAAQAKDSWPALLSGRYRYRAVAAAAALIILALAAALYFSQRRDEPQLAGGDQNTEELAHRPAPESPIDQSPQPVPSPRDESAQGAKPGSVAAEQAWKVERLEGAPKVGSESIHDTGSLAVGQWLETDSASRARVDVGEIGHVEVDPDTRIRLVRARSNEHRLALARGRLQAKIYAPPRLFFVNTPSAVAVDYGCAYTLEVDDAGASRLRVTSGWVALVLNGRESMVPAGAVCVTRPGVGPGTPYFEDASETFLSALTRFDFEGGGGDSLDTMLAEARARDTLTLWHLIARVSKPARSRLFDRIAELVPLPDQVTKEGVLRLDQKMLDFWKEELQWSW